MVTTKERTEIRAELVSQGFSWEYVDEWQPKITLYRHAAILSESGVIVSPVGTKIVNLPGNPDYVLRKARLGMFPYLPGDTCECRWCVARQVNDPEAELEPEKVAKATEEFVTCQICNAAVTALTKAGALSRLRVHMKTHEE